jgi:hypothetical protein
VDVAQKAAAETAKGTRLALDILSSINVSERYLAPLPLNSMRRCVQFLRRVKFFSRSRRMERQHMAMTDTARQITGAFASMTVRAVLLSSCSVLASLTPCFPPQLIDMSTDDAIISDFVSSAASSCDIKPKGRTNHNFGATKSRAEVHQFLRRNPHYLPHAETHPESPSQGQGAFDADFISRYGAKNRSADAYKNDINGTRPRKI